MIGDIWLGKVFGKNGHGGNYTAVVLRDFPSPAATARTFGFPDSAFVTHSADRTATVRTFSPYEELAQCLQTSLAVPVALGAQDGQTWQVRHPAGELLVRAEREADRWLCWAHSQDRGSQAAQPIDDVPAWLAALRPLSVERLNQGRNRLYAAIDGAGEAVTPNPTDLRALCEAHRCSGIVLYDTSSPKMVRARVFTASLAYREDSATGGAAAGIATILAQQGRSGVVPVVQGPDEEARRGHLLMSIDRTIRIGGHVQPLLTGRAAF